MSENQAENESESSLPTFRPFTREELAVIENRITEKKLAAKKKAERRARNIAVMYQTQRIIVHIITLLHTMYFSNRFSR